METQHRNAVSAQLAADINATGEALRELLGRIESYVEDQHHHAKATGDHDEMSRLAEANPFRWIEDAERALQSGVMFAARAIAQPSTF